MMVLATDMGDMQRDLADSQKLLDRIQSVMNGRGRVGIFPDLAAARTKSVEMMNQLVGTRQKFAGKIRAILDPILTAEERKAAGPARDRARRLRAAATATCRQPTRACCSKSATMKERFGEIDRQASELNVEIQALEAQLVAIENYYRVSRAEQKIRPEDIRGPVRDMRATIEELRGVHEKLREAIADARRDATTAGGIGESERADDARSCPRLLQQELEIARRAMTRLQGGDRVQVERMSDLLARCDAIEKQLQALRPAHRRARSTTRLVDRQPATWPPARKSWRASRRSWAAIMEDVEDHGRRPRAGDVHQGRRQVLRPRRPAPTSASSTCRGASRTRRPRRSRG